jgi:hypothetical protein
MTANKVYLSKKGFMVWALLSILIIIEVSYLFNGLYLPGIICLALTGVIVLPIVFNTRYTINTNGILQVKCGLLINLSIPVASIKRITPTKTIFSAPALSLDRLEVFYGTYDSVVISPERKDEFIKLLQSINPAIEYISGL